MDYNWQIILDQFASPGARSVTFADRTETPRPATAGPLVARPGTATRPTSAATSVISDSAYMPFSIEPEHGSILAGKKASFTVKFSPLEVQDFEARLICR